MFCEIYTAKPVIWVDMDGVVADFDTHYENLWGPRIKGGNDKELWKNINNHGTFFRDLPLMPGAVEAMDFLYRHFTVRMLTACPSSNYEVSSNHKKQWFKERFNDNTLVLTVMGGKNKKLFMQKPGEILVDDFEKNIIPWVEAGGIGIHHKNWEDSLARIQAYI